MVENRTPILDKLQPWLDENNSAGLMTELNTLHAVDIAGGFRELPLALRIQCLSAMDPQKAADVVEALDFDILTETLPQLAQERLVAILEQMPSDEAADVLNTFDDAIASELIQKIPDLRQAKSLKELVTYPEDSCGGRMSSEFVQIYTDMTAEDTLKFLRIKAERDNTSFYYLFVVDRHDHLVGVLGLRRLITASPYLTVDQIMNPEVISVNHYDDQSLAAERIQKYQLLTLPVVDDVGRLKGIITWDDAAEVVEEELTDEFYTSSGLSTDEFYTEELLAGKLSTAIKSRTPWLLVTMIGSLIAVSVGDHFAGTIASVPLLAIFIPLLGGLGGNVGTQSSALIVRGLATGHTSWEKMPAHVFRQALVGGLIGVLLGTLVGTLVGLWIGNPWFGLVIGFGLLGNITVAATLGTLVPFVFKRLNIDPAISSGPFITTAIDVTGLTIYFGFATLALSHLQGH